MIDLIFREYDIRGKVGSELNPDDVYDFARSLAYYFKQLNPATQKIAVGMDGRTHSPHLKEKLCAGLLDSGLDILFLGICPSPALYFALHTLPVDAGVMITASHNPKEYNGFKICMGTTCVWGTQITQLRDLFKRRATLGATTKGSIIESPIVDPYVTWLHDHFKQLVGLQLPMVIDCANGAGAAVIPALIERMEWPNAQMLCCTIDGSYPNHEADPTKKENMRDVTHALATTDAVLGIGLDGDADRMTPMTKSGRLVRGDELLALFCKSVLEEFPNSSVIVDIKSSSALLELITRWGGIPILSPSGHAIIKEEMKRTKAPIGGELSCHFIFADHYFGFDDAIYAFLRLLELMRTTGRSLDELLTIIPERFGSAEIRMPCPEEQKKRMIAAVKQFFAHQRDAEFNELDGVRVSMPYGWGIVRASNTQAMLSLRFEANTQDGLARIKKDFFYALSPYFEPSFLYKYLELKDQI
ncbi:phosphomannomutase/phosphoglucomutase [Candidatus Dependentiae bacterium]|nr:phosphomannomutase/phosphoglucomutase [Candidatus Dependentiae bacterium]MCC7415014.1 phosphomannomutase/phosphoglucomutase [Campylobacterota bacterium]